MPGILNEDFLEEKLAGRKEEGAFRSLPHYENLIDFCSNDYLGFARNPTIITFDECSLPNGATGSRLISGNSLLAEETENIIAAYHQAEAALIFNSGYAANVGFFSCIAGKNDLLIHDELIHASVIDGMRLSPAKRIKFRHNDVDDLNKKLHLNGNKKFVAIESVYSMDGDLAPLKEIIKCCEENNAYLIVDEAHTTGVFGKNGEGLVNEMRFEKKAFARIITFGKALGLHGAAVLGSNTLRNYLINYARAFIYTTALPPQLYWHLQKAYKILPGADRKKLFGLIEYFHHKAKEISGYKFSLNPSPVQALMMEGNKNATAMGTHLQQKGMAVKAILSPTVKASEERIRICIHSFNTTEEINNLFKAIRSFKQ